MACSRTGWAIGLFLCLGMVLSSSAWAGSSYNYWIGTEGGGDGKTWSHSDNWGLLDTDPPGGVDARADFSWPDTFTVDVDLDLTLGHLYYDGGGGMNVNLVWTSLTLAVSSGSPKLEVTSGYMAMQTATPVSGTQGFEKLGDGVLALYADSSYTGETVVSAGGIVTEGAEHAFGATGAGNGTSVTGSGAYVSIAGYTSIYEDFTIAGVGNGNGVLQVGAGVHVHGTIDLADDASIRTTGEYSYPYRHLNGAISLGSHELTLDVDGTLLQIDGAISGTGGLTVTGTHTVLLTATNTYEGGTTILGGKVQVTADDQLGASSGGVTLNGGELYLDYDSGSEETLSRAVTLGASGGTLKSGAALLTVTQALTGSGTFTTNTVADSATILLQGNNTNTGDIVVYGGTLHLTGDNSEMTGDITVTTAASLLAGLSDSLSSYTRVTVEQVGTFTLEGSEGFGSLAGAGSVAIGVYEMGVGYDNTDAEFSGSLTGSATVLKHGTGAWTLSGDNSGYSGQTTVYAGTLVAANDDALGSGQVVLDGGTLLVDAGTTVDNAIDLGSAGTIGGTGTFQTNIAAASGTTVAPGASAGLLTIDGGLTQATGSTLAMELGGTTRGSGYDALVITGQLDAAGTLDVTLIDGFTPGLGDAFDLLDWGSLGSDRFASVNLPTLSNGLSWDTASLYTTGTISVIPEPATVALLALGAVFLPKRRRRVPRAS